MSGLIFKGDTVNNFGEFLPCPYIEKIYVSEFGFTVQISLFINTFSASPDVELIKNQLSALTYYVTPVWQTPRHKILANYKTEDIFKLLPVDATYTHLQSVAPLANSVYNDKITLQWHAYKFSDFVEVAGPFYDDKNNVVLKFIIPLNDVEDTDGADITLASDPRATNGWSVQSSNDYGLPLDSEKFLRWTEALPRYDNELSDYGYQDYKIVAWSSNIDVGTNRSAGLDATFNKYNANTGVLESAPISRSKAEPILLFPARCGFAPRYVSAFGTEGGAPQEYSTIVGAGDALLDMEGTGVDATRLHSPGVRSQAILQRFVFNESSLMGYLTPEQAGLATAMDSYKGLTTAEVTAKCLSEHAEAYSMVVPTYDLSVERYGDTQLHSITPTGPGSPTLASDNVESALPIWAETNTFNNLPPALINQYVSDISYEQVVEDGAVITPQQTMYLRADGAVYSGERIQALDGFMYASDEITLEKIVTNFKEMLDSYEEAAKKDRELATIIAEVSTVFQLRGDEPTFIPEMNKLRYAWPDKSTATTTGHLYERLKRYIYNANTAVKNQGPESRLQRRVIANTKVVNQSFSSEGHYFDPPQLPSERDMDPDGYQYPSPYLYNDYMKVSRRHVEGGEAYDEGGYVDLGDGSGDAYIRSSGYFFFDFEKALATESAISTIFPIAKLNLLFGRDLFQHKFKFKTVYMGRRFCNEPTIGDIFTDGAISGYDPTGQLSRTERDSSILMKRFKLSFDTGTQVLKPTVNYLEQHTNDDYPDSGFEIRKVLNWRGDYGDAAAGFTTSTDYSYIALRAFGGISTVPGAIGLENYRLAAFEFQDYYDMYSPAYSIDPAFRDPREFYRVKVWINDETMRMYDSIIYHYRQTKNQLEGYLDAARENCSYNGDNTVFNTFFADGIEGNYSENPASAPWVRAPIEFQIHKDLLFNTHMGDKDRILAMALKNTNNINPRTGNLPDLETFWADYKQLYDEMYDAPAYDGTSDPVEGPAPSSSLFGSDDEGASRYTPKQKQASLGRDRILKFSTDYTNLPAIIDAPDPASSTGIDDSIAWCRFDLATYFELISTGFPGGSGEFTVGQAIGGYAGDKAGAQWNTSGRPTNQDVIWSFLHRMHIRQGSMDTSIYDLIYSSADGEIFAYDYSNKYLNYCLGDLWVLLVVQARELGLTEADAVNLIVYDTPFYAEIDTMRFVDPAADGALDTVRVEALYGGILDRMDDSKRTTVLTNYGGVHGQRATAIYNLARAFNMTNIFSPQDNSGEASISMLAGDYPDALEAALRVIRESGAFNEFTFDTDAFGALTSSRGRKWWDGAGLLDIGSHNAAVKDILTRVAGRNTAQLALYDSAARQIYRTAEFTSAHQRLRIPGTRGGTPRTANALPAGASPPDGFTGMESLVYQAGPVTATEIYGSDMQFPGMPMEDLINLTGGTGGS